MRGGDTVDYVCSWMSGRCSEFYHSTGIFETLRYRHPSSVFFANRFRSADSQKIQLPPGGSQGVLDRACTIQPGTSEHPRLRADAIRPYRAVF